MTHYRCAFPAIHLTFPLIHYARLTQRFLRSVQLLMYTTNINTSISTVINGICFGPSKENGLGVNSRHSRRGKVEEWRQWPAPSSASTPSRSPGESPMTPGDVKVIRNVSCLRYRPVLLLNSWLELDQCVELFWCLSAIFLGKNYYQSMGRLMFSILNSDLFFE